jgi:hypothetical protein
MIDSFGFQNELTQNDERIVRSTFDIKLNGYIIPEILQKDITALKKFSNKTKIVFEIETTDNVSLQNINPILNQQNIIDKTSFIDLPLDSNPTNI